MIKKSIFKVFVFATAMTGAMVLSSCSHDDITYNENKVKEANQLQGHAQVIAQYKSAFVSTVGQPAANQNWDFTKGGGLKTTRGASDSESLNEWPTLSAFANGFNNKYANGEGDPMPENVLSSDIYKNDLALIVSEINKAAAKEDFKTLPTTGAYAFRTVASYRTSQINVNKDKYYSIGANFGGHNNYLALMGVKKNKNNAKHGTTGNQHTCAIVFDNVPEGAAWFAVTTYQKGDAFKASEFPLVNFVEVTVNDRTYWGFKCDTDGDKDGKGGAYTDLILWVKKVTIGNTLDIAKRYMVEDLGSGSGSDIDFNDIVFDVQQYSDGTQKCVVRALGGTLPITININGYKWTKPAPIESMINTGADGKAIDYKKEIASFEVKGWIESENNVSVEVQDKNGYNFITAFPENGDIPLMVAFSTVKHWNAERKPVDEGWFTTYTYPFNFDDYVFE